MELFENIPGQILCKHPDGDGSGKIDPQEDDKDDSDGEPTSL